ncbi:MAG TPA: type IV toxin-antitoxin system AbiEi family antitoxin domain-containing protein [Candidatus Krumholzibacteria bacterium]|nr:type IV toxin-antitoxin system AbiEi family antitoxin domain-containing protein [Candidatus Krumholzibacteria bacterium]HPD72384.1 type IV toxin-antitoxin system AbiEi family antitoxin domain-containing protein [Candidatus Krumholzibacteria bacterium]HRY40684.1 type IV toxin-antitoxin system AbiEi family antitoxin domain-containing protein [Candidatus Krumholzibacteria bacterium]
MTMARRPEDLFRDHGGQLRMSEAIRLGMSRYMLYELRARGVIEQVSRGIYRLVDLPPIGYPDLVTVALRVPRGVVCLVSALAFHELTTQVPHEVSLAIPRGSRPPRLDHPPTRVYRFGAEAFAAGVEEHRLDEVPVRVYCPEKTLADAFKFRNRIGMDLVQEALKFYRARRRPDFDAVLHYARICRVDRVMRPYLEALI